METYDEILQWLYTQLPMFQRQGAPAYKPGLHTSVTLDKAFGSPHAKFPSIHIAGTNGKGSTAHTIAAVLQSAGYKVGLYTSPHLVDFRERIRVNGKMIPKQNVMEFVKRFRAMNLDIHPSFFELTMMLAFDYFAESEVDMAVIEVGMGGRLDSTNIITPQLSVITNISFDHTAFLGNTLEAIASEKAGIIKPGVPVVIGEATGGVRRVFADKAAEVGAPIVFAQDTDILKAERSADGCWTYTDTPFGTVQGELGGDCQPLNAATIMNAVVQLRNIGWMITDKDVQKGFSGVNELTGLQGRWMTISTAPLVIADTGHNVGGWQYLSAQLAAFPGRKHMVIGFVNDKDISHILDMMPRENAVYYFTQSSVLRALPADDLAAIAAAQGLTGEVCRSVDAAYAKALGAVAEGEMVFVGGSTFVVADLLTALQ